MMAIINNIITELISFFPESLVWSFAKPYIAGTRLEDALKVIKSLNDRNISATLDFLGEDPRIKEECINAVGVYKKALDGITSMGLESGVSLKLSHMGLKLDEQFCYENIREIAAHAGKHGCFLRIDMEDVSLKDQTIHVYLKLRKEFANIGIASQAYLRQSIDDLSGLIEEKANVRLCKGAYYWEPEKHVYKNGNVINDSYAYLLEKLFSNNCFAAIATHDDQIAFQAVRLIDKYQVSKDRYEFQMLYGVQEGLRDTLLEMGHPVRIYVPFGEKWHPYCMRRLKENPKMVSYIFSNLIKKILKR